MIQLLPTQTNQLFPSKKPFTIIYSEKLGSASILMRFRQAHFVAFILPHSALMCVCAFRW